MDKIKQTMTASKIDDFTLEVTKQPITPEPVITKYERSFIEQQIKNIQSQKDEFDSMRDRELKECNDILAAMDKLSIISKPIEIPVEKPPEPTPVIDAKPLSEIITP